MLDESTAADRLFGNPTPPPQTLMGGKEADTPPAATPANVDPAQALFGGSTTKGDTPNNTAPDRKAEDAPQRPPKTEEDMQKALFGEKEPKVKPNLPQGIEEMRNADPDRRMYSAQTAYGSSLPDNLLADVEGIEADTKQAAVREFREIAYDIGADTRQVQEFVNLANRTRANPPDSKTVVEWQAEAAKRLKQNFGDGADRVFAQAQALVNRDPRVALMLKTTGLGNHPDVVMHFVRLAQHQAVKHAQKAAKK